MVTKPVVIEDAQSFKYRIKAVPKKDEWEEYYAQFEETTDPSPPPPVIEQVAISPKEQEINASQIPRSILNELIANVELEKQVLQKINKLIPEGI